MNSNIAFFHIAKFFILSKDKDFQTILVASFYLRFVYKRLQTFTNDFK